MFRLWGKEFKDNRMLKDLVICDESMIPVRIKFFMPWMKSAMNLI